MEHFADSRQAAPADPAAAPATVEDRLRRRIVDGDRIGLDRDLAEAMRAHDPLSIINDILLDGMRTVGELFGSGQMQLPFVLQSAETMKAAVTLLEPHMEKTDSSVKGTVVLATVKGDVHDIGKNLVDIILTNNGYRVINLGIKVPVEQMLATATEQHADAIGMSGLLVKSTLVMKENLSLMRARGISLPVMLGGAALTRRFVEDDLRPLYDGPVRYARDAFDGLHFMNEILGGGLRPDPAARHTAHGTTDAVPLETDPPARNADETTRVDMTTSNASGSVTGTDEKRTPEEQHAPGGAAMEAALHLRDAQARQAEGHRAIVGTRDRRPVFRLRSEVARDVPLPRVPFYGSKLVTDIAIEKVYEYINEVALVRGQWQFRRGTRSEDEYRRELETVVRPRLEQLKLQLKREHVLHPAVVYGYFPCQSDGDDLVIYRPRGAEIEELFTPWERADYTAAELTEWLRFTFPRQSGDRYLCIADFFRPINDGIIDVCAFHVVTMGTRASEYTAALFEQDKYQDYLYIHGMTVESAEALAEYWHKAIRVELGIDGRDAADIRRLFSQGYQGSRYSFGYPACPNLEDQAQLFTLLRPERIGITLTDEYQLVPEQSTSAIIVHHPEAKYFNVK
jgi:5-methyltetrahydrofolate--homocysteine methyltransferase